MAYTFACRWWTYGSLTDLECIAAKFSTFRKDFARIITVLLSYCLMTDWDLGRSDVVKNEEAGSYMTLDADLTSLGQLYLEDQPIALPQEFVGEGTTCYRARTLESKGWGCKESARAPRVGTMPFQSTIFCLF